MRRLSFDHFEFDDLAAEEALDLVVSSVREHWPLTAFLSAYGASGQIGGPPPAGWPRWMEVTATLRERAGVQLPSIEECEVVVISDSWDDLELAVVSGRTLVWYHWWTTA